MIRVALIWIQSYLGRRSLLAAIIDFVRLSGERSCLAVCHSLFVLFSLAALPCVTVTMRESCARKVFDSVPFPLIHLVKTRDSLFQIELSSVTPLDLAIASRICCHCTFACSLSIRKSRPTS
jgi:hypothetical protein